jgi:hypothetical protein
MYRHNPQTNEHVPVGGSETEARRNGIRTARVEPLKRHPRIVPLCAPLCGRGAIPLDQMKFLGKSATVAHLLPTTHQRWLGTFWQDGLKGLRFETG